MSFDFEQFKKDIRDVEEDRFLIIRMALRDEEARRTSLPFVEERENEIAEGWLEANPPEIDEETNTPLWVQPTGAHNAWPAGAIVSYDGQLWQNIHTAPNAWEPGNPQHMWRQMTFPAPDPNAPATPQAWVQPTGAHNAYAPGSVVSHNGKLWRNSHTGGNAWEPGNPQHQWVEVGTAGPETPVEPEAPADPEAPTETEAEAWVQPAGAGDAYEPGAIVSHNGSTWENVHTGANSWEPGNPQHQWVEVSSE